MRNKTILRIVLLAGIALLIFGGWLVKNHTRKPETASSADAEPSNPDFELNVSTAIDIRKLKSYGLPIVIDFGADSCIPCKEMAPVLKELNNALRGKAIIKFVDVWKYQSLSQGYPISVIPTQVFIGADGKPFKPADPEAYGMKMYEYESSGEHAFTTHEGGLTKSQLLNILKEMGATL